MALALKGPKHEIFVFYIIQACIGRWLKKYGTLTKLTFILFGPDIRNFFRVNLTRFMREQIV